LPSVALCSTPQNFLQVSTSRSFVRDPFAKFLDSPCNSESELCGGAVTVSFSKYLPWQAMSFVQRSTHFSKTCCRPLITSKFLASELLFHGWKVQKSYGERSELNSVFGLLKVDRRNPIRTSAIPSRFRLILRGKKFEVINGLQHVFEKWVERCKKCIACQGRYFEKDTVTAPPQSSDSEK
jgi:hypothetical protein